MTDRTTAQSPGSIGAWRVGASRRFCPRVQDAVTQVAARIPGVGELGCALCALGWCSDGSSWLGSQDYLLFDLGRASGACLCSMRIRAALEGNRCDHRDADSSRYDPR